MKQGLFCIMEGDHGTESGDSRICFLGPRAHLNYGVSLTPGLKVMKFLDDITVRKSTAGLTAELSSNKAAPPSHEPTVFSSKISGST